jgi:hypothetical protein
MLKRAAVGIAVAVALAGCQGPQPEGQLPFAQLNDQAWKQVYMTSGPSFKVACYNGDRLYFLDSYLNRSAEEHQTSPKALAVSPGGCKRGN